MTAPVYVFAKSAKEISKYVDECWDGKNGFRDFDLMRRLFAKAYEAYYGQKWSYEHGTVRIGDQGEYTGININELRSQIKGVISLTTENRVVFDCVTTSTDVQAQNNVIIGNSLLERKFYVDKVESKTKQMLEQGLVFGTSYLYVGFKKSDKLVGVSGEGRTVYSGDLDIKPLSQLDVMVDPYLEQWDEHEYVMFRRLENRFNLAAEYPEVAEDILKLPIPKNLLMSSSNVDVDTQPNVWVYYTFHKPTKAIGLEQGMFHKCVDKNITLFHDVNPYECLPVICYRPGMMYGSSQGHALSWDLMPVQEAMNTLDSSMLTMAENFAIPNILADRMFGAEETALSGGMKLIVGQSVPDVPNGGFPHAMDMPKPDQTYMELNNTYQQRMMNLSGLNAAARGQTTAQQSGTAIALAQSAAQTFNSSVEFGYVTALEETASMILRVCKLFLTKEEIIAQAGLSMEYAASTYANASLEQIASVKIDMGNSLAKTVSGRVEMGTQLLNQGQISASEYLAILQTGSLPKTIQSKTSGDTLISKENEMLMTGQHPIMSVIDNHLAHINAHKSVLDNPNLRAEANIIALVMQHLEEHLSIMEQLKVENPQLLDIALNQPLGTTQQAMAGVAPQPGQPQSAPPTVQSKASDQSAAAAIEGGPDAAAQSGRDRAAKKLESMGADGSQVEGPAQ